MKNKPVSNKNKSGKNSTASYLHGIRIYIGFIILAIFVVVGMLFQHSINDTVALGSVPVRATILFGGDMMFDRTVRSAMEKNGDDFVLSCLDPLFKEPDVVVANLEGPITSNPSMSQGAAYLSGESMTFTFAPSVAGLLYRHNVRIVNIGNNHIMNFSRSGLLETKKYLEAAGVQYFGDPDKIESEKVLRTDIGGVAFSFINWSDWTSDNTDITAAQVKTEHEAGRIVVIYTHWGEEYQPATARMKRLAHNLVDEGADIVIGSHPHIVQEHEVYKDKHIYYSLGNLIFDQYFDPAVMRGLMLQVRFGKDGVEHIDEIPVELQKDRRTCPVV